MEEYIDIVTRDGKPTGKSVPKSEIHKKGHYHNTAHIWLYTKNGYVLLQQRAASKTIHPLLWDVSVAGHIDAGESPKDGAVREAQEEIGISIVKNDLIKIGVFECFQQYPNGITDNEFHHTFICELKVDINNLVPQPSEVEALKLVSVKEFETHLEHSEENNHFIATNKSYYQKVLEAIKRKIQY